MIKRLFFLPFLLATTISVLAQQVKLSAYADTLFTPYFHQRVSLFRQLPASPEDIIFAGNSITDGNEWSELFNDNRIKNRGISGDITAGLLYRVKDITQGKPSKVFILIGVNDLARNISTDSVVKNILQAAAFIRQQSPATKIYIQSILPVNDAYARFAGHTSKGKQIQQVNRLLEAGASAHGYDYIDIHTAFCDLQGKLQRDLTNDGLHLNGKAYLLWKHLIYPYVYDLSERPSLIPYPQMISWGNGCFPVYDCRKVVYNDTLLAAEAEKLRMLIPGLHDIHVGYGNDNTEPAVLLQLDRQFTTPQYSEEGYQLTVKPGQITIRARTPHGIFNGIQTLRQLMRDGSLIPACDISDWPAFSFRGFMTDVGRNYQSVEMLRKQIDVMAAYKMNVFHFHATEDIAWRIAIKQYPQLTAPAHMLRDKGLYYSEEEIKELIAYCRERYITFIPEIDMPGHSAAFRRAMGTDMQSDSGLIILRRILNEFMDTYDLPYLHIGADEVKITNPGFLPQIISLIESRGKKVIGWEPGGNFNERTIRQLWMDDNGKIVTNKRLTYIDSRHLYLNHMDPLEAVVTVFNRKIGNRLSGDSSALGGTLCVWNDRAVAKETDILAMNPVYPGIITFAERTWRGGGNDGWVSGIGPAGTPAADSFERYEQRLLDHKKIYFQGEPFPYVKQSDNRWQLFGPYLNKGQLTEKFEPELSGIKKLKPALMTTGGTIVLRHWWAPLVKAVVPDPAENSTWYAATTLWSDEDRIADCWIGFNNLSRSPATDSPLSGTWDNHQSKIWVNGIAISPPAWKRAGQKGHSEIPLSDEGYEYRAPARILLKKGWNEILVKCPIGSFKGKDWQNPEKWMFTFVLLN